MSARGGFDPRYVPRLIQVERRHFWFRARNNVIAALARQVVTGLPQGYRVLDAGCGTGNTLRTLHDACQLGHVFGMDLFFEGLPHARGSSGRPVVRADLRQLPFTGVFHAIGLFDVLEHVEDDVGALIEVRSLLDPAGALLVTVPADPRLWSRFDEAAHHCRRYTRDTLTACLRRAGFAVEYMTPFMMPLYPIAWMARKVCIPSQTATASCDAPELRDLRVIPVGNTLLGWMVAAEPMFLRARWQLPLGTSLIAVARVAAGGTS